MWKQVFRIWRHRNEILHGKTQEEQAGIRQEAMHTAIQEIYDLHETNPSIVSASDQHLFDATIDHLFRRNRQYKLCWMLSVEVAVRHQQRDTARLRRQSSRFFGKPQAVNFTTARIPIDNTPKQRNRREIPLTDISSPEKYNLRNRRRLSFTSEEESDGFILPSAMFWDPSESSYEYSEAKDLPFQCDTPISSTEIARLEPSDTPATLDTAATHTSSEYSGSRNTDVPLLFDCSIATSELAALGPNGNTDTSSRTCDFSTQHCPGTYTPPQPLIIDELPRFLLTAGEQHPLEVHSMSPSISIDQWRPPSFPLAAIGPLVVPTSSVENPPRINSPLPSSPEECGLVGVCRISWKQPLRIQRSTQTGQLLRW